MQAAASEALLEKVELLPEREGRLVAAVARAKSFWMTASHQLLPTEPDDLRRHVSLLLRPFVEGTVKGVSHWMMTEARVARTARDAAEAILPLLGTPARSAHRVRGLIVPALTCSWTELEAVYEEMLTKLLALPVAVPGVVDPTWDANLMGPRVMARHWNAHGSAWSAEADESGIVVGPCGTSGRLLRPDRRHALIVEDGRAVRTNALCTCVPRLRRERGEVGFELITFGRGGSILEARVGVTCAICRAPVA